MQLRIQPNHHRACFPLTDQHVGDLGHHKPIPPADIDDPDARMLVRDKPYEDPQLIAREKWRFAKDVDGQQVADETHVWLEGGFEAGRIYDILYTPRDCLVVGAGMLATRDLASFLRYEKDLPLGGAVKHVIGEGQSQCGRFLRTYLNFGMNTDEAGRAAFDGVLAHIAGGRRGEFNHRYAQPSVQPTPSFDTCFRSRIYRKPIRLQAKRQVYSIGIVNPEICRRFSTRIRLRSIGGGMQDCHTRI